MPMFEVPILMIVRDFYLIYWLIRDRLGLSFIKLTSLRDSSENFWKADISAGI
jgi:hypothetical protein